MTGDRSSVFAPTLLVVGLTAAGYASSSGGQTPKFGFQFKQPTGGPICFDGDGTVVACPPPDGGSSGGTTGTSDTSGSSTDAALMKKKEGHGDSWFCNLCHVNPTNEVAGPRMLRDSALADAAVFWRRHNAIATLVTNKSVLKNVRGARTLTPTLQRLMAARPSR